MDADPVVAGLSSTDPRRRQEALYQALSERRADLVPFIQLCAVNEPDPELAVLAAQVALSLASDPPDEARERQLRPRLVDARSLAGLAPGDWLFLARQARKSLLAHIFKIMGSNPPSSATAFFEQTLQHPDPDVRAWATVPAAHSQEPTVFAHLLSRTCDPDRRVARAAFIAIQGMPVPVQVGHIDRAFRSTDQWVQTTVASFLPMLASKALEPNLTRLRNHSQPMIAERAREALHRLEQIELRNEAVKRAATTLNSSLQATRSEKPKPRAVPPWESNPEPLPPRWGGGVNDPIPPMKPVPGLPKSSSGTRQSAPQPASAPVRSPAAGKTLPDSRSSGGLFPGNTAILDEQLQAELEGRPAARQSPTPPGVPQTAGVSGDQDRRSPATSPGQTGMSAPSQTSSPLESVSAPSSVIDLSGIPVPPRPAPQAGPEKKLKVSFRDKLGKGEGGDGKPAGDQPPQSPLPGMPPSGSSSTTAPHAAGEARPGVDQSEKAASAVTANLPPTPSGSQSTALVPPPVVPEKPSAAESQTQLPKAGSSVTPPDSDQTPLQESVKSTAPGTLTASSPAISGSRGPTTSPSEPSKKAPELGTTEAAKPAPTADGKSPSPIAATTVSEPPPRPAPIATPPSAAAAGGSAPAPAAATPSPKPPVEEVPPSKVAPAEAPAPTPAAPSPSPASPSPASAASAPKAAPAPSIENMDLASAAGVLGAPAAGPPGGDLGMLSFTKTSVIESILQRYPSFITRPLDKLFMPELATEHLRNIRQTLEGLLGFLNFAFLQAYLFYATKTPKGDQTVKETLKAHLLGPNASRHLHHLALAIKDVKGNDKIFPFPMAKVITEPAETNPLFILKEMYEAALNPTPEVMESLDGMVEQLGPMMVGFKGIISNRLIMRMPPGAREPYLDLTGPQSAPLAKAQQPELDLPPNEPIILSSDRGEALGLFPYFTFDGQGLVFGPPDTATFATLLERLSLSDLNG